MEPINIFKYTSYREYIDDFIGFKKSTKNISFRYFAQKAEINSPNYIQKLIKGDRSLTIEMSKKLAKGFDLSELEAKYLQQMVYFAHGKTESKRAQATAEMLRLTQLALTKTVDDITFFSNWLYGLIWEALHIKALQNKQALINKFLKLTTANEIEVALEFLLKKDYIEMEIENQFTPKPLFFKPHSDVKRHLDIQRNHVFYLDLAKHRLIADLNKREYQGLTVAIDVQRFAEIKDRIKSFVHEINDEFSGEEAASDIIRLQVACYFV